jgi:RimJ/RimL family protein N-acetyltransferase
MLEGLLVDLVPYGDRYLEQEHRWHNSEAWWWATAGDREPVSQSAIRRRHQERAEWVEQHGPSPSVWFGIQTKEGKPLGDIALGWVMPHYRLSMLGAGIGEPEYWGGGYGTDALLLIVDYAFDWLDLHKLWLGTMSCNVRVLRQMEKVGFVREAVRRQQWYGDGVWYDDVMFGLLREEWPGREAMIERLGLKARAGKGS